MSYSQDSTPGRRPLDAIAEHRTWFIILGIVLILLGCLAFVFPLASSIATKVYIGWLFLIGGGVQIFHAFQTKTWGSFMMDLLIGLLYFAVGAWLAFLPLSGLISLTIMLAFLFLFQGVLEAVIAFNIRPTEGWGWVLFSGIISGLAGLMLLLGLPGTAAWGIGILVAINMITSGWSFLALAIAAGKRDA